MTVIVWISCLRIYTSDKENTCFIFKQKPRNVFCAKIKRFKKFIFQPRDGLINIKTWKTNELGQIIYFLKRFHLNLSHRGELWIIITKKEIKNSKEEERRTMRNEDGKRVMCNVRNEHEFLKGAKPLTTLVIDDWNNELAGILTSLIGTSPFLYSFRVTVFPSPVLASPDIAKTPSRSGKFFPFCSFSGIPSLSMHLNFKNRRKKNIDEFGKKKKPNLIADKDFAKNPTNALNVSIYHFNEKGWELNGGQQV